LCLGGGGGEKKNFSLFFFFFNFFFFFFFGGLFFLFFFCFVLCKILFVFVLGVGGEMEKPKTPSNFILFLNFMFN